MGLMLLLAACAAEPSAPARSAPAPTLPEVSGLTAEAVRLRTDEAVGGQLQVRVTNTGTAPFTVTAVQLDTPGFAVLPPTAADTEYQPGRVIDLPTPFGDVDCATSPEPAAARLTVLRPDGAPEELRVPLGGGTLARVHEEECAVQAVGAVVGVTVADLADAGETVTGDVVLTRRSGEEPVTVSALGGSVVLTPVPDDDLPVTLGARETELQLPVTFDAARCDPHALAETKQPFVFPLSVGVGDAEPVPVDLPLDEAQRAVLTALLGRVCTG